MKKDWIPPCYDGIFNHGPMQNLSFSVIRNIKSFRLKLFVQDVFKTDTDDYSIKTPGFLYENKFYGDKKFVGFCVIWKKSGEKYKKREIEEIKDKNINRLHPE